MYTMSQLYARFPNTRRRVLSPYRPVRHGKVRWWRGTVTIGEVTLELQASPSGMALPSGVRLEPEMHSKVEAYFTEQARQLNGRGGGHGR